MNDKFDLSVNYYPTALTPPNMKPRVLDYAAPPAEQEAAKGSNTFSGFDFIPYSGDIGELVASLPIGAIGDALGSTVSAVGDVGGAIVSGAGEVVCSIAEGVSL